MAIENISRQLRPRRGSLSGMELSTIVLAAGEIFVEYPDTGVGTGASKIKIGDGTTQYKDLPYAIEPNEASASTVTYNDDTATTVTAALGHCVSGAALSTIVPALKQAVNLLNGEAVKTITSTGSTITVTGSGNSINIEANPTGAISTVYETDLGASKVVVTNASGKIDDSTTVTASEIEYVAGVTSAIQTQINGKQDTITGAATTITDTDLGASKVLISNSSGKVAVAANTTSDEIDYVHGVTSAIQTQINGKSDLGHTHTEADITGGISVSMLTAGSSGTEKIDIELLPEGALERLVDVADEAALRALTSDDVQKGDLVKVLDSGLLYYCTHSDNLPVGPSGTIEDSFEEFTVGAATSVPWSGVTGKPQYITYVSGITSDAQTQINGKQATITGAATTITDTDLSTSKALVSNASGKVAAHSDTTSDEIGYVHGVTAAIQTQINGKSDLGHTHTMSEVTDLYGDFSGATSAADGATGFVPAPDAGDEEKYLCGNGEWVAFVNATTAAAGLMSAADKIVIEELKDEDVFDFGDETPVTP